MDIIRKKLFSAINLGDKADFSESGDNGN